MYLIRDFARLFRLTTRTVRELITRGEIKAIKIGHEIKIPESEFVKFGSITRVPVFDLNIWRENNSGKLERWNDALNNQTRNVLWYEMNLQDFIAYYYFLILPVKQRKFGKNYSRPPSFKWLERNGFKGFTRAFSSGYLWKYGIRDMKSFFKQLETIQVTGGCVE